MTQTMIRVHLRDEGLKAGMYHNNHVCNHVHEVQGAHPLPDTDDALMRDCARIGCMNRLGDFPSMDMVYGFRDLPQMLRWIYRDEWLDLLEEQDLVVAEVTTDKLAIGLTQCVGELTSMKTVREIPYDEIRTVMGSRP